MLSFVTAYRHEITQRQVNFPDQISKKDKSTLSTQMSSFCHDGPRLFRAQDVDTFLNLIFGNHSFNIPAYNSILSPFNNLLRPTNILQISKLNKLEYSCLSAVCSGYLFHETKIHRHLILLLVYYSKAQIITYTKTITFRYL